LRKPRRTLFRRGAPTGGYTPAYSSEMLLLV